MGEEQGSALESPVDEIVNYSFFIIYFGCDKCILNAIWKKRKNKIQT